MKLKYRILVIIALANAVLTALPMKASKLCLLGYYAHCSLTPVSTVLCVLIAGIIYWIGVRRSK